MQATALMAASLRGCVPAELGRPGQSSMIEDSSHHIQMTMCDTTPEALQVAARNLLTCWN